MGPPGKVGTGDAAGGHVNGIKSDCRALQLVVRSPGTWVLPWDRLEEEDTGDASKSLSVGVELVAGPQVLWLGDLFADWCRFGTHLPKGM